MFKSRPDNLSLKTLTARYVVALGLLAVTTTASMFYLQKVISEQKYHSNLIAQASKEQFLVKEIELYHLGLIASQDKERQISFRRKLSDAASDLESNHNVLLDREESNNLGGEILPSVRAIYFDDPIQLNRQISDYIDLARTLSTSTNEQITNQPILSSNFVELSKTLLKYTKQVVEAHIIQSQRALERTRLVETLLWILSLIALALIGVFIFRPLMNTITYQFKDLRKQRSILEENLLALKTTQNELVKTQKIASLGRMVSGFSHELSTPIGIAVSAVSQIEDAANRINHDLEAESSNIESIKGHSTMLRETAMLASRNLSRAGRLMENFKQTSIDCHSDRSRDFDLKKLTEDTIYALSHQLKQKSVAVEIECPTSLSLNGKPSLIEQLITNLVTNSLSHGCPQDGGIILIEWKYIGSENVISLRYKDDGVGISSSISDKIFEPFFTTKRTGGSGLGLYICHSIATEDLKGQISCNTDTIQGAEFNIQFPLQI
jgi:signal transduction histidine kinase